MDIWFWLLILLIAAFFVAGVWVFILGIKDIDAFLISIGLVVMLSVIIPVSYVFYNQYQEAHCTKTVQEVYATVTNKNYEPSYITYVSTGKSTTTIMHPEEYNVTLQYQGISNDIDNEELYKKVNVKDKAKVILTIYRYKNGNLYKKEINLE